MKRFVVAYFLLSIISLIVYSYSQIDLNLTLSSQKYYQNFQNIMLNLGYYNRPLSTIIYLIILASLFISYYFILKLVKANKLSNKEVWKLIIISGFLLLFSYSAFSHDIFNYMFDARILTKYGLNPYQYKALDFPNDLWIRFMHWTHRYYPYGPVWLLLTLPFSFLGLQKFTLTFLLFKGLFLISYLLSCYFIFQLGKNTKSGNLFSLSFFAFNPLILIEGLVSPHNDSLTLLFILLSLYFLTKQKYFKSFIGVLFSTGIKFISTPLMFISILYFFKKFRDKYYGNIFSIFFIIYTITMFIVLLIREFLPWYIIPLVGIASLVSSNKLIRLFSVLISFGLLLKYVSFIYEGQWTLGAYNNYLIVLISLVILSFIINLRYEFKK